MSNPIGGDLTKVNRGNRLVSLDSKVDSFLKPIWSAGRNLIWVTWFSGGWAVERCISFATWIVMGAPSYHSIYYLIYLLTQLIMNSLHKMRRALCDWRGVDVVGCIVRGA